MSTIMPQGESIRKAIKWISEHLKDDPLSDISALINKASVRFDLNPRESSFLTGFYKDRRNKQDD